MGRVRHLRRLLGRMRRDSSGTVAIPQEDGTIARFSEQDLAPAFLVALDRELGRTTEDHPLCIAARRSPDPKWSESFYAGPEEVPDPPPDLSE
jgi:hypothetical protein